MSDILQLGKHPDADQLSAFIENAVPAHERGEMLAHLADCGECRQILALSLAPLEEPSPPRAETETTASLWPGSGWFSGWKLAWIGAPALAAVAFLTVHLRESSRSGQQSARSAQIAETHPSSRPTNVSPQGEHRATENGAVSLGPVAKLRRATPSGAEPATEVTTDRRERASARGAPTAGQSIGGPVVRSAGVAGLASGLGASEAKRAVGEAQQGSSAAPFANESFGRMAPAPSARANAPAEISSVGAARTAGATRLNDPASYLAPAGNAKVQARGFAAVAPLSKSGVVSPPAPLPSGQSILAYAESLNRRVAIDARHNLFCSEDNGRHWKQVSAPWPGRAAAIAIISPAGSHSNSFLVAPERFAAGATVPAGASAHPGAVDSSLSGTVVDPSGAVIPGADIAIKETRSAMLRTGESDATGHYLFANLPPGSYRIDVQAPGFVKQSLVENLAPSQQAGRDVVLPVGQATQTVTVETAKAQMETHSRSEGSVADAVDSAKLPLPSQRGPIFAVTTDRGERWTSLDGQSWKQE